MLLMSSVVPLMTVMIQRQRWELREFIVKTMIEGNYAYFQNEKVSISF